MMIFRRNLLLEGSLKKSLLQEGQNSEEFVLKKTIFSYLPSTAFFGLSLFPDYLNEKHDI
jgi:hypothetical protein